jgi:hypothetical protein
MPFSKEEMEIWKSQIVITNNERIGGGSGLKGKRE